MLACTAIMGHFLFIDDRFARIESSLECAERLILFIRSSTGDLLILFIYLKNSPAAYIITKICVSGFNWCLISSEPSATFEMNYHSMH